MNLKRVLTLTVVGGALAALIAGAATTGYHRAPITPPHRSQTDKADRSSATLAVEIARLHERLRPTAAPEQPSRNLFTFRSSRRSTRLYDVEPPPVAAEPAAPVVETPAPLELIGLASDGVDTALVRTAILSGFGQLFLAKEGEAVTERFRVTRIGADVVELSDTQSPTPVRLALRDRR
jgi:hypothetical protein